MALAVAAASAYYSYALSGPSPSVAVVLGGLYWAAPLSGAAPPPQWVGALIGLVGTVLAVVRRDKEPIRDVLLGRVGRSPSAPLLAAATAATLAWIRGAGLGVQVWLAASGFLSGALAASLARDPAGKVVLGLLSGLPLLGPALAVAGARAPLRLSCPGIAVGGLVALGIEASKPRRLEEVPVLACAAGRASLPPGVRRVLAVGSVPGTLQRGLHIILEPGEDDPSSLVGRLQRTARAPATIRLSGTPLDRALIGLIVDEARRRGGLLVEACRPGMDEAVARIVEKMGDLWVVARLCGVPSPSLQRLFTGKGSVRVACPPMDIHISLWAAREILGLEMDDAARRVTRLASQGLCIADKLCPQGLPGVFSPRYRLNS